MRRLGILGGTFDPVHYGHLVMAEAALTQFELEQVIWVPSYQPPHKSTAHPLDFQHRLAMLQRALQEQSSTPAVSDQLSFIVTDIERGTHGTAPSYAIDTLKALQQLYPDGQWFWIIGLDAFRTLPQWYKGAELASQCTWLVAPRPPSESSEPGLHQVIEQMQSRGMRVTGAGLDTPHIGISSSLIRHYCRLGRSIRYLTPEAVRLYIQDHNLYADSIPLSDLGGGNG